tara:strand:- start:8061 stop:8681 length:621 start_codon:yes stop_codon:yes gene_type:complete
MAYNILSGTVIAAAKYWPGGIVKNAIVSGNLSTSNGAEIINVPRVSSPVNNGVITNLNGDANTLTCESAMRFDGSALNVIGEITASVGVSASYFYGDGSRLTGVTASSGTGRLTVNSIGDANGDLTAGFNYGSATFTGARQWRTPASPTVGDVIHVKAPAGVSATNTLKIVTYADHRLDGLGSLTIESPHTALSLCYVVSGSYRIF